MANNLKFKIGSPASDMEALQSNTGTLYLTDYVADNQDSNRLYIGTSDAIGGVKPITTPTPYHLTISMNGVKELDKYTGSENETVDLVINNDGVYQMGSEHAAVHYALCNTASDVAEKATDIMGFVLTPGARIHIKFLNTNTAETPKLNINKTGAQNIDFNNKLPYLIAGNIYTFIYDGTNYVLLDENHRVDGLGGEYAEVFNDPENIASGMYSHAEGAETQAIGDASHAEGKGTIANGVAQHVQGKYNVADTTSALIIGNGTSETRSNAYKIDFSGNSVQPGTISAKGGNMSGHIYFTGAAENSSTSNTSQIVFGTASNNHVAISSNKKALIINPDISTTANQIVLYLDQASQFPNGVSSAIKLHTARTIQTNLASTSAASFDGTSNITPGVTGTLPIANGGTGATTAANARTNLEISKEFVTLGTNQTITGQKTFGGNIILTKNVNYGDSLPTSGVDGQIFFIPHADENIYEYLPLTGGVVNGTIQATKFIGDLEGTVESANKVNTNLSIKLNNGTTEGTNLFTFNGSTAKTINITPSAIGAYTKAEVDTKLTNLSVTNATNANNLKVNDTTANTNYYILGAAAGGGNNQTVYRAFNSSGSANKVGVYFNGTSGVLYGAAWNDYAEYRETKEEIEAGRVVCETGKGDLTLSTERLQPGAEIISDTFGFAIGETETCKTAIAATGRVLAYPYEDRESYKAGDAVCAGPNGTVSKMTREEIREYPDRIIGTVSEIPEYETWGQTSVPVNGRIWIRIR